ncbi:MAG: NADAR family protein [Erysipelotrichaceae bacterium]|nr:NADAR family protein [Erysipelotrichaceae bacterium]
MNIICFHNPDEENGYLSNWYLSDFIFDGIKYSSMEQYMMYQKAICFGDESIANQILTTNDVAYIKSLGRNVSNYDDNYWNGIRQVVVYKGLMEKFKQNGDLKTELLNTGNSFLVECAVKDKIWGIGLSMNNPDRYSRIKWQGQNLLGYTLMMVRNELK